MFLLCGLGVKWCDARVWLSLGRAAARSAFHCATVARYRNTPPRVSALRRSSREIVDGDRPIRRAISPTPSCSAFKSAASAAGRWVCGPRWAAWAIATTTRWPRAFSRASRAKCWIDSASERARRPARRSSAGSRAGTTRIGVTHRWAICSRPTSSGGRSEDWWQRVPPSTEMHAMERIDICGNEALRPAGAGRLRYGFPVNKERRAGITGKRRPDPCVTPLHTKTTQEEHQHALQPDLQ
jgi:hypothetical protein